MHANFSEFVNNSYKFDLFRRGITRRSAARTRKRYGRPRTRLGVRSRLTRPAACWTSAARPVRSTFSPKGSFLTTIPYCRASVGVIIEALAARKYRLKYNEELTNIPELLYNIFYRLTFLSSSNFAY